MYSNITGVILAGGKSTRMGQNKSLLKINGLTVIERITQLMSSIFKNVILITNTPEEYKFLDIPMFKDIYENKGPLAGIHSGPSNSLTEKNFIISCDLPLMTKEMIVYMINYKTEKVITICEADGFVQHLVGNYCKSVLPIAEKLLANGMKETKDANQKKRKCSVYNLLDIVGPEIIDVKKKPFYKEGTFYNLNRPEDYELIVEKIGKN